MGSDTDARSDQARAARNSGFDAIQRAAETAGLPRYEAWCATLERRYSVMPPWYWDTAKRRIAYADHVRASLAWQRRQARINAGNQGFFHLLREHGRP